MLDFRKFHRISFERIGDIFEPVFVQKKKKKLVKKKLKQVFKEIYSVYTTIRGKPPLILSTVVRII